MTALVPRRGCPLAVPQCGSGALCSRKAQLPELPSPSTCLEAGAPRPRPEPLPACRAVFFRRRTLGGSHSTFTHSPPGAPSRHENGTRPGGSRTLCRHGACSAHETTPRLAHGPVVGRAVVTRRPPRTGLRNHVRPQRSARGRRGQGRRRAVVRAGEARTWHTAVQ